ncbi:MAG: tRNA pseudouridine(38-40) synthase TruA [Thermoclostridium sp.]|nr:tRNA pseudouridine(38-40) synthase TruA [Thermoclostridium sp.]
MHSRRIKLVIEYDGSGFHGWQVQENAHSVQEELEKAIAAITGESARITGAGRTDTGVHAYGQVAHFDTRSKVPAEKFSAALNSVLPPEVSILASQEVPEDFHARFTAVGKTYEYRILNRATRSPILAKRAWHIREALDLDAMGLAAEKFIGEHNFSAFCSSGHSVLTFNRTLTASQWIRQDDCLVYRVSGNGFLYNMVRIMTGTMVEVGLKKRSADSIEALIQEKDRNKAGITAPPHGLYLLKVHYPPENC